MQILKYVLGLLLAATLVACGGGGGSAGTTGTGGTGGTTGGSTTDGGTVVESNGSISIAVLGGSGAATNSISAVEIAQVSVTVKDASGVAVPGVVVTFTESGAGLVAFAPTSGTALTDAAGVAIIEIRAANSANIGATTIGAAATVAGVALSAVKSISISNAPASGGVVDPQTLANALNFLDVNPADRSIVLAGSGGNGRSESATLRFRVVDANNTPVQGALVNFVVVPAGDVTLNIPSATSDAEGVVVTTVSSKSVATAVVVNATVATRLISSQSDQLLVTTGVATAAGFDLSATKYNLNHSLTGDSSVITVRIVDANGNPVADGVPVVFTANFGRVGSSSQGGCSTLNGQCDVTFAVQNPRPGDGVLANVTASTRVGDGSTISDIISFQLSQPGLLNLYTAASAGSVISGFNLALLGSCKATFAPYLGTPQSFPAPAGTTVELTSLTTDLVGSIKLGSPVLDNLVFGTRTQVGIEIDASALACNPAGTNTATGLVQIKFTAAPNVVPVNVLVTYPVL